MSALTKVKFGQYTNVRLKRFDPLRPLAVLKLRLLQRVGLLLTLWKLFIFIPNSNPVPLLALLWFWWRDCNPSSAKSSPSVKSKSVASCSGYEYGLSFFLSAICRRRIHSMFELLTSSDKSLNRTIFQNGSCELWNQIKQEGSAVQWVVVVTWGGSRIHQAFESS